MITPENLTLQFLFSSNILSSPLLYEKSSQQIPPFDCYVAYRTPIKCLVSTPASSQTHESRSTL